MTYKERCKEIIKFYGIEHQKRKLIEECAELIVAISKDDYTNMAEEVADVCFLIDQLTTCPEFSEMVISYQQAKVERQMFRMEKEKHDKKI